MPGPVNSASAAGAIASLIQHAVSAQVQSGKRSATAGKTRKATRKAGDHGQPPLAELIARRAEELDPDARDYRSRLLRLVIEASLLHELGSNLLNAPKFQSMVDQVLHELESAPQLKHDVSAVLDGLTKG
ncbi:MAG: hypothetical protein QM749_11580 [Aquabacterium sp.]